MDWVQQTPGLSRSGQAEPRRRGDMQARKAGTGHRACPAVDRQNHGGGGVMQARKAGRGQRVGVSCLGSGGSHTPFLQL